MGLSSVAAIAFSAMQAQSNNLAATADDIANADGYEPQGPAEASGEDVDLDTQMAELEEDDLAYRSSAAAFETGADLWAILSVVTRD